jgi:hypothetical protein
MRMASSTRKSIQVFPIVIALAFVLLCSVRDAGCLLDIVRLRSGGIAVLADVRATETRLVAIWPYRAEYQFGAGGTPVNEPDFPGLLGDGIGAPLSHQLWQEARQTGGVPVLYLPRHPEVNLPAARGWWGWIFLAERSWAVASKLSALLLLLLALVGTVSDRRTGDLVRLTAGPALAVIGGWILLVAGLRVKHLIVGAASMDAMGIALSLSMTLAWLGLPVGFLIALARRLHLLPRPENA